MLSQVKPPFRAEHIGSLLRPTALLQQRAKFARGEIDAGTLGKAENQAIKDALVLQERIGFKLATDGEFRRRSYHSYFYGKLGDIKIDTVGGEEAGAGKPGQRAAQPVALINSRLRWSEPINVPDFQFIKSNTSLVPKITIPGPARCTSAAAMRRCLPAPIPMSSSSGMIRLRRSDKSSTPSRPLGAATSRSMKPRSPNSAIPTCRRS
jgi:methionine synthase II (cobalamin-independent)